MNKHTKKQDGYTIVELLIATTIFSIVLLIAATAIIHIGRMYYKGGLTTRTQEASRSAIEDVAQAIQFGASGNLYHVTGTGSGGVPLEAYCIGTTRYTFARGPYLGEVPHVFWKDTISGQAGSCVTADITGSPTVGTELLNTNMRLPLFEITQTGDLWNIQLRVSYSDSLDDFLNPVTMEQCRGVINGGSFCATSYNSTTVVRRLN